MSVSAHDCEHLTRASGRAQRTARPRPRSRLGLQLLVTAALGLSCPLWEPEVGELVSRWATWKALRMAQGYSDRTGRLGCEILGTWGGVGANGPGTAPFPGAGRGAAVGLSWGAREALGALHAPPRQLAPALLCAGPRRATTPATPGPGQIREPRAPCPAPRSRDLHRPPGRASRPYPFTQAALTEAVAVSAEQLGCVAIPWGRRSQRPCLFSTALQKRPNYSLKAGLEPSSCSCTGLNYASPRASRRAGPGRGRSLVLNWLRVRSLSRPSPWAPRDAGKPWERFLPFPRAASRTGRWGLFLPRAAHFFPRKQL